MPIMSVPLSPMRRLSFVVFVLLSMHLIHVHGPQVCGSHQRVAIVDAHLAHLPANDIHI